MRNRLRVPVGVLAVVIAFVLLAPLPVNGQTSLASFVRVAEAFGEGAQAPTTPAKATATPTTRTPPRTPWGHPDLQGIWNNNEDAITPLERPAALADKPVLTQEGADERSERQKQTSFELGGTGSGPVFWYERGVSTRTSLIVDPQDGRMPPLTPEGQKRTAARTQARRGRGPADGPEDLGTWVRCITRGVPGAMIPNAYNNNYQILQTPGYVVILYEMIHDARIIPLDGRPHVDKNIRLWMGDSRGHWEGDTLVVEVTNFNDEGAFAGASSETFRLVERFTRVDADSIKYEFTVGDPKTFTRPWTAFLPLTKIGSPSRIFEYACHEGNYGLLNILSGTRAQEKKATEEAPNRK